MLKLSDLKIGDKVKVKSLEQLRMEFSIGKLGGLCGKIFFNAQSMTCYCGEVLVVNWIFTSFLHAKEHPTCSPQKW